MKRLFAAVAVLSMMAAAPAAAVTVTYTLSGNFAGTLAGNGFAVAATFTGIGDTSTVFTGPNFKVVTLTSFKAVAGSTTYTITTPTIFFANVNGVSGFSNDPNGDYLDFSAAALTTYDPTTSIGATPVAVDYTDTFETDQGQVELTSATDLVFSASAGAVPEPATWGLMITGFAMTGLSVRRRRTMLAR